MHLKYGKMFAIVVGEKRGHIGRVFFVFFFFKSKVLCAPVCKTNDRFASYESVIMEARSFQNRF